VPQPGFFILYIFYM